MATSARYDRLIEDLAGEFRPQREWAEGRGVFLIVGHFVVGVGAGTWMFALYFGDTGAQVLAFVLAALGGLAHLFNLNRPERALWMMMRVATSWVARGFWGLSLFLGGGVLALVPAVAPGLAWSADGAIAAAGTVVATAGAVILICYMGFVYSASKGVPFWNSPLHPVLYVAYAFRGGAAALMLVLAARGAALDPSWNLLEIWIAVTALVIVLWLLDIHSLLGHGEDAVRRSLRDLFAGRLAVYFYGGILVIGLVVPVLLVAGVAGTSTAAIAGVGLASVAGDFFIKFSSIKAGVIQPVKLPHLHHIR